MVAIMFKKTLINGRMASGNNRRFFQRGDGVRALKAFPLTCCLALALAGCSVDPERLTMADHEARMRADMASLFGDQERITGAITLSEAIARALKYNLDDRLKLMEEAVAAGQTEVANLNLLPAVTANAGYDTRSKADSTFNETRSTTSTTSEKQILTSDLHVSWNILDFGIGYLRARQQADLSLIVRERRRQVIHNIMQETRSAYWRAAAAERALQSFEPLLDLVRDALLGSERAVDERVGSQIDNLVYQRNLLETLRQLEGLRRDMLTAHTELAVLMNVHPQSSFSVAAAGKDAARPELGLRVEEEVLERLALLNRSELRSETYQLRVHQEEARVALLQMIPGLGFSAGVNRTSDQFKLNQQWYDGSLQLTWNLMNVIRGPANIRLAETEQELSRVRRLALSMAVIAQVNVAALRFDTAKRDFELAARIAEVESRIRTELDRSRQARVGSELQLVEGEIRLALADLRRDMAYADLQASFGRMIASIGLDPDFPASRDASVASIAQAVEAMMARWEAGDFPETASRSGSVDDGIAAAPAKIAQARASATELQQPGRAIGPRMPAASNPAPSVQAQLLRPVGFDLN